MTVQNKIRVILIVLALLVFIFNQTKQNESTNGMYPKKFDRTKLTVDDQAILQEFATRRKSFDNFIKENNLLLFTCPGCGFPTLTERGGDDICAVCNWQDNNQDDKNEDEIWGGPNQDLSLTQNRLNIGKAFKKLTDSIGGKLNDDHNDVISILIDHEKRIDEICNKMPTPTESSDSLSREYEQESKKILTKLIKRQ